MTPTESILGPASDRHSVRDALGRDIKFRHLNALDKLRLLKAAGPILSENQAWLGIAMLAASVTEFEGVPIPVPVTEQQIEAIVSKIGDSGLDAVADGLTLHSQGDASVLAATTGNSPGTPT